MASIWMNADLEKEKAALLVVLAALSDGCKVVLAVTLPEVPGNRPSVGRDLRARELGAPRVVIGIGHLGPWRTCSRRPRDRGAGITSSARWLIGPRKPSSRWPSRCFPGFRAPRRVQMPKGARTSFSTGVSNGGTTTQPGLWRGTGIAW